MYKSSSETHGQYHKHLLTVSICEKGSGFLTICLYLTCIIFNIKFGNIQEKYILKIPFLNSNFQLQNTNEKKPGHIYKDEQEHSHMYSCPSHALCTNDPTTGAGDVLPWRGMLF